MPVCSNRVVMDTSEIIRRLRIGLALVVGFLTGKAFAVTLQHHASEFFIGGFLLGVVLTQFVFWVFDQWTGKAPGRREDQTGRR